jgi:type I restriction enzyme S subunit
MSSKWPTVQLGDCTELVTGFPFKSAQYSESPDAIRLLRGDNIGQGILRWDGVKRWQCQASQELSGYQLRELDIVLAMDRPWIPAGLKFARVRKSDLPSLLVQRVARMRPLDCIRADYLNCVIASSEFTEYIQNVTTGTAVPHISAKQIREFKFKLPELATQALVGQFLANLDDRINLLRETNATLEAIAQALFKSWFVDFDPVRAKMEGRAPEGMDEATAALFPDGLEESELGMVPKGWHIRPLGEVCSVTIGGLWGKDTKEEVELVPVFSLRGVDLENLRTLGFASDAPLRWVKPAAMEKRRINENEVLIASSGAGPCGRPLWAGAAFESIYGIPVIFSNFVKRLDCGSPGRAIYVDRLLASMRESKEIWNYINGTSIPNLDDKLLLATKKIVVPGDEVLASFENIVRTIYAKLYSGQAQTLAQLRDSLLPRLISGQLRLPSVAPEIEPVAA